MFLQTSPLSPVFRKPIELVSCYEYAEQYTDERENGGRVKPAIKQDSPDDTNDQTSDD
jgi:hypothetical protein